jgi:enoyl-CoA hydratase/carnithine racemase
VTVRGIETEVRGKVGWIFLNDYQETAEASLTDPDYEHPAYGVPRALAEFDADPAIHVVVLTGRNEGEFYRVCRAEHYDDASNRGRLDPVKRAQRPASAFRRSAQEVMATMHKPLVARLNGDAIGLGQAFLWGCDIIVAREDAVIADVHTGQQEVVDSAGEVRGFPWAVTPGDGAMAFAPLYMSPVKLKEYMFLSRTWTAKQLADMHIVNYAVPTDQLDEVVNRIIDGLLARPLPVLAHTKRVCNKPMVEQWNLTQDLASAYEMLDFFGHSAAGRMS